MNAQQSATEMLASYRAARGKYTCQLLAQQCTTFGVIVDGNVHDVPGEQPLTDAQKNRLRSFAVLEGYQHGMVWQGMYWVGNCYSGPEWHPDTHIWHVFGA